LTGFEKPHVPSFPVSDGLVRFVTARRLPFRVRALVYFGLGALQRLIGVIMSPLFAHYLDPAQFGLLMIILSGEALILLLFDLRLSVGVTRAFFLVDKQKAPAFGAHAQIVAFQVSWIVLLVLGGAAAIYLYGWPQPRTVALAIGLTLFSAMAQSINNTAAAVYRSQEDAYSFATLALLRIIGVPVLTVVLFFAGYFSLPVIMGARVAVFGGTAAFELIRANGRRERSLEKTEFPEFMRVAWRRYSLPMLPYGLMIWGRSQGMRAVLATVMPLTLVGIYSVASLPLQAISLVGATLDQLFDPIYFRILRDHGDAGHDRLRAAGTLSVAAQAAVAIMSMAIMPDMYRILFPPTYWEASIIAPILLAAQLFVVMQSTFQRALVRQNRVGMLPIITAISTIAGLVVMVAGAKLWGLAGASAGYVSTGVSAALMVTWLARRNGSDPTIPDRVCVVLGFVALAAAVAPIALNVDAAWWTSLASAWVRYPFYVLLSVAVTLPVLLAHRDLARELLLDRKPAKAATPEGPHADHS